MQKRTAKQVRPITERSTIKIGGTVINSYKRFQDGLEVITVVRSGDSFYGVVTTGRRAYKAFYLPLNSAVEITGTVSEMSVPVESGHKTALSISCTGLRVGEDLQPPSKDVGDFFPDQPEMSKHEIFRRIDELNHS